MKYLITPLMDKHSKYKFAVNELCDMYSFDWISDDLRINLVTNQPMRVPELMTDILRTLQDTNKVIEPDSVQKRKYLIFPYTL